VPGNTPEPHAFFSGGGAIAKVLTCDGWVATAVCASPRCRPAFCEVGLGGVCTFLELLCAGEEGFVCLRAEPSVVPFFGPFRLSFFGEDDCTWCQPPLLPLAGLVADPRSAMISASTAAPRVEADYAAGTKLAHSTARGR